MTPRLFGFAPALVAAVVAGVTLASAPAAAQQGWATSAVGLSASNFEAGGAHVAFDAAGNGFAVYGLYDGTTVSVWLVRFDVAIGAWRLPAMQLSPPGQETLSPRVAIDGAGNAVVAWIRETAGVYYVQGLTYSAATGLWSAPVDVATVGPGGAGPDLAVTPGGHAVVVWTALTSSQPLALSIHAARYTAGLGTWSAPVQISATGDVAALARVAMSPTGDAVAAWSREASATTEEVQAARFAANTGTWLAPQTLSAASAYAEDAAVAMDDAGNAIVAWHRPPLVEAARYDAAGNTWSLAAALSTNQAVSGPAVAGDHDGNTTVVWQAASGAVETSRYDAALAAWSAAAAIAGATASGQPAIAVDATGNVAAFWPSSVLPGGSGQGARYVRASGVWSSTHTLATSGTPELVAMAADGTGNFGVVWNSSTASPVVFATRWSGAPRAPSIVSTVLTSASIEVYLAPPVTDDAAFAPTAYEYSLSTRPWVRVPLASPLVVPRPFPGVWHVAVRAVNAAGGGAETGASVAIAPQPPTGLAVVAVTGSLVTLAWEPPPDAFSGFTYVVEGGVAPGQVLASIPTGSAMPAFTFTAPAGVFRVRVRAAFIQLLSQPSNEVVLAVNVPVPPSPPEHLLGLVSGSALALTWSPTFAGGTPTGYSLVVSGPVSGVVPVGAADSFQFPAVPPGTYTFQVVATNAVGQSPPSNTVTLTFPGTCSGSPGTPRRLVVERAVRTLSLSWSPPDTGAAATSYVLQVSGAFTGAVPLTGRGLAAPVPPGAYTFQLQAVNACGASPPTAPVTVVVP